MAANELHETARALVADNKGILAADESSGTIKKRFDSITLESTEENRRAYRDMLFTTPELEEYVSGVILYDETMRQSRRRDAVREAARRQGDHPRDQGRHGREGPRARPGREGHRGPRRPARAAEEYRELGARFAKWRAVITIGDGIPTRYCIDATPCARPLRGALPGAGARPDRRARGADGRRQRHRACYGATARTLHTVFDELYHQHVDLEGMLLKPNMVISGKGARSRRAPRRSPSGRSGASARPCPRRCPGSSSSPAASPTSRRART